MRTTLFLILAATVGLCLVIVLGPDEDLRSPDLQRPGNGSEGRGGGSEVFGHRIRTSGVFTPREAKTLIDGELVTYPELFVWSGSSAPEGEQGHRFDDLRILWNPTPRNATDLQALTDIPVETPRGELPGAIASAIGSRSPGLIAGNARILGDRGLSRVQNMDLGGGVRWDLLDPSRRAETRISGKSDTLGLRFEDGRIARLEAKSSIRLEGPIGFLEGSGLHASIETGVVTVEGPVSGVLEGAEWVAALLPGIDRDQPVQWSAAAGLRYLPDDPQRDRRERSLHGLVELRGSVRFEQGNRSFEGSDLNLRIAGAAMQLEEVRSNKPLSIKTDRFELSATGLTWSRGDEQSQARLETAAGTVVLTWLHASEGLPGAPRAKTFTVKAHGGLTWTGLGTSAQTPWTVELRDRVHIQGAEIEGLAAKMRLELMSELGLDRINTRVPRRLELEGEAWVRFADGQLSGDRLDLERIPASAEQPMIERARARGTPRLVWTALDLPPDADATLTAWIGRSGWIDLRANEQVQLERRADQPTSARITADRGVRIERRVQEVGKPAGDMVPVATLLCDTLTMDIRQSPYRDSLDAEAPGWGIERVEFVGGVEGTMPSRATLRAENLVVDLVAGRINMTSSAESSLNLVEGQRALVARVIRLDIKLRHLALDGDVELIGWLPRVALGRLFGGDSTALPGLFDTKPSTLRTDSASLWMLPPDDQHPWGQVGALRAQSEGELQFVQPGSVTMTGKTLQADFASGWFHARGAPLDVRNLRADKSTDRFLAPSLTVTENKAWVEGPVRATIHVARGALPLDVPGWRRAAELGQRVVPANLRAEDNLLLTSDRIVAKGKVELQLQDDETGDMVVTRGDRLLLSLTEQAPADDPSMPGGPRRLERAAVTGNAYFRTTEFEGSGEVLFVSVDHRNLVLYTPDGLAKLTAPGAGTLEKAQFEIDFSNPDNPRLIFSDVPVRR